MHRSRGIHVLFFVLITSLVSGDEPSITETMRILIPGMDTTDVTTLAMENKIVRYYYENVRPIWMPDGELSIRLLQEIDRIESTVGVEAVFLIDPADLGWSSDSRLDSEKTLLAMYNALLSVSTLKDIEYYSVTRNRMRVLFTDSYRIDDPESGIRVPDIVAGKIPQIREIYAAQTDTTFGRQTNRITYRGSESALSLSITNLTPLRYGLLKVAGQEHMQIHLMLVPADTVLVFYGNVTVRTARLLGLERSSNESFYNRIQALHAWFLAELETIPADF